MEPPTTDTQYGNDAGAVSTAPASRLEGLRARRQLLADAALLLVTLIWGATFVMVKDAVSTFPVFSFMALRFTLAALALAPLALWQRQVRRPPRRTEEPKLHQGYQQPRAPSFLRSFVVSIVSRKRTGVLLASTLAGLALFAGYAFQTAGLISTTPAKAGFITGLSVVIVPVVSALLLRHSPRAMPGWAWRSPPSDWR